MVGIHHRIGIKAPAAKVYAAISTVEGVAAWWTRETSGSSAKKGDTVDVRFTAPDGSEKGRMAFDVTELAPDKKVQWRFRSGPEEENGDPSSSERLGDIDSVLESAHDLVPFQQLRDRVVLELPGGPTLALGPHHQHVVLVESVRG